MSIKPLTTTVVGSFPTSPNKDWLVNSIRKGEDPFLASIEEAAEVQISAGIDIISDGQTRNDMIRLFTTKLGGIRMKGKPVVIGRIDFREPIIAEDQKFVKSVIGNGCQLKGIITGPYTLAMSCTDEYYGSQEKLAFAFAEALNHEARVLDGIVDMIQVDEPFYSLGFPEYASELIATTFSGVNKPRALHACGDVSKIFEKLVDFDVDILDHEFAAHPELLDVVSDVDFKQMIGFGCVRSDDDMVEGVNTILERVKKGIASIGDERLLLDPDCGLKHLSAEVASQKLENMVKARGEIRNES